MWLIWNRYFTETIFMKSIWLIFPTCVSFSFIWSGINNVLAMTKTYNRIYFYDNYLFNYFLSYKIIWWQHLCIVKQVESSIGGSWTSNLKLSRVLSIFPKIILMTIAQQYILNECLKCVEKLCTFHTRLISSLYFLLNLNAKFTTSEHIYCHEHKFNSNLKFVSNLFISIFQKISRQSCR